ncbi:hypothetical protein M422DRAFT_51844 [Sphaerobolus stellatus SS14]|uniref:Uncharacterized protein n=1 Tax=Sphaerobolus stellatus (strain SS14) TaxID=990650 RepID=A0A0C9VBS6_SPHS4|nr:hypothetical protein M422DRAFT_51844 [Sphaerobolus stellatus SS14]
MRLPIQVLNCYQHHVNDIVLVFPTKLKFSIDIGFSWHLQIPDIITPVEEHPKVSEICHTIETPQLHTDSLNLYWSLDSTGSEKFGPSQLPSFGLTSNSISTWKTLIVFSLDAKDFNVVWNIHEKLGLDPESDQAAHTLGLPLMEFYGLDDEEYYSEGSSSSDSYHTAVDTEDEDKYVDCE